MFKQFCSLNRGVLNSLFALSFILFVPQVSYAEDLECFEESIVPIITNANAARGSSISDDGTRITFISNGNINNDNPEGNREVYFHNTTSGTIANITKETDPIGAVSSVSISGNGNVIAFSSNAINEFNTENNPDIFTYNLITGIRKPITNITDTTRRSVTPSVNYNGSHIAFISDADHTGDNSDGNAEVFLYSKASGIKQITDTDMGACRAVDISADGLTVAFGCRANVNNGNPELNNEVYFYDVSAETITQVTDHAGLEPSGRPSVNEDGSIIAFSSQAPLVGNNSDGNSELYYYDRSQAMIKRITDTELASDEPSISPDGRRIAFTARDSITGENPDNSQELYMYDIETKQFAQVTNAVGADARSPSTSLFGTHIAFIGVGNVTGDHPDLIAELHIARCSAPKDIRNVPTLSEWGLLAMAALLGIAGLVFARRKKLITN